MAYGTAGMFICQRPGDSVSANFSRPSGTAQTASQPGARSAGLLAIVPPELIALPDYWKSFLRTWSSCQASLKHFL